MEYTDKRWELLEKLRAELNEDEIVNALVDGLSEEDVEQTFSDIADWFGIDLGLDEEEDD